MEKNSDQSKQSQKQSALAVQSEESDAVAQKAAPSFPIIGIGASAGGLEAFKKFFTNINTGAESEMAFVLVQHLDPEHKSILVDLIKEYTQIPVYEVVDGVELQPRCVYIIPPNRDMALLHGKLHLIEPESPRGSRMAVDFFFRSLAQDQHERAIGIILSGTGTDGTSGVKAIKEEGGMVMVQTPNSAKYDGMPRSAMGTGLVDYVLPAEQMPAQLLTYIEQAFGKLSPVAPMLVPESDNALQKIFISLRAQTGHDFSYYKQNTIRRRIERRMAVNQIEEFGHYVRYLHQNLREVDTLFRELLIGVTGFFRDPKAFETLATVALPALMEKKVPGSSLRVWVPGCSTGEEALSLAIVFQEYIENLKRDFKIQIFATDIDDVAIEKARKGLYPSSIGEAVSPERLSRFFQQEDGSYRAKKGLRDMVVFAEQNVIQDPPFSKLDLVSCRNLLIYMRPELQKRIIPLFHYALNPGGFLFLGSSETIGEFVDLFEAVDRRWKLYRRKDALSPTPILSDLSAMPPMAQMRVELAPSLSDSESSINIRELAEQTLLTDYTPASVVVNEKGEVLYIHGRTGRYLEPAPGEASLNILRMAREGLLTELAAAIRKAVAQNETARYTGLQIQGNGDSYTVNLTVAPLTKPTSTHRLLLVVFEHLPFAQKEEAPIVLNTVADKDQRIADLEQKLRAKEEHLQTIIEELETSNEELKSTNEELQSTNEELQSTNEELETSKEEMQSVNEELVTVNTELQKSVDELSQVNNDMNNLMAGTGVGTIFVDHELRIQRFTPAVTKIINLIQTDIGRPVGHIVSNLVEYKNLIQDTQSVLDSLIPTDAEVQTTDGQWYLMRILPYRTIENVIEGAVLTFVEMTAQKQAQEAMQESTERFRAIFEQSTDSIVLINVESGALVEFNDNTHQELGYTRSEFDGLTLYDFTVGESTEAVAAAVTDHISKCIENGSHIFETKHRAKNGEIRDVEIRSKAISLRNGNLILSIWQDITERKRISGLQRLATIVRDSNDAITVQDFNGQILAWNPRAERMYGWSEAEAIGTNISDIIPEEKRQDALDYLAKIANEENVQPFQTERLTRDGRSIKIWFTASVLVDESGQPYAVATTERSVTVHS